MERGRLLLSGIEVLVIDEADRMLDMGFIPDIERICKLVPFTRQTLFFSATMPPEIQRLVAQFLSNPVRVEVSKPSTASATITQGLVASGSEDYEKRDVLRGLIRDADALQNAIVFCNRKREVAVLHRSLQKHGFNAVCLHGDMDQHARMQALDQFRTGEATILVASDVAARGLDIPAVSHVFNYDVPHHAEDYVHRIGRTGRAGRSGAAFSLVTHEDAKSLAAIEKLIGNAIPWIGEPLGEAPPRAKRDDRRGGRDEKNRKKGGGRERERRGETAEREPRAPREDEGRGRRRSGEARAEPRAEEARAPEPRTREPREPRPQENRAPRDGQERPVRPRREHDRAASEPADMSHLPAFLLRPVRIKAG